MQKVGSMNGLSAPSEMMIDKTYFVLILSLYITV